MHNCGSRYALTWRESQERAWAARAETPTQHIWHFAAILPRLLNCFLLLFLVVSSRDSLTLEEPVKVLKVGLYISACRVACGEVLTGIKSTLGCSGKAEG